MANTIKNNSDGRDALLDEIERLEKTDAGVSKPRLPQTRLDNMEYTPATDAEIADAAKTELDESRRKGEQAVRDKNAEEAKTFSAQRENYEKALSGALDSLARRYDAAVESANNDAVKRGLARSSIAAVNRGEIESEYLKQNTEIAETYGKKLSELDAEISALDGKLKTALDDFNLSYATRLDARINELKAERDRKTESVIKYNNEVRQKQAKLDEDRARAEAELYAQELKNKKASTNINDVSAAERDKIYRSVYDAMDKFLSGMDVQQARIELLNHTVYREHLSDYYYYRLYDKYVKSDGPENFKAKD